MPFDPMENVARLASDAAEAAKAVASQARSAAQAAGHAVQEAGKVVQTTASDFADKAAQTASDGAQAVQDSANRAQRDIDLWRYNPLFPERFADPDYTRPKMVVLADPSQRKGIEVCKGSIGWTSKEGSLDVLHLYETAIKASNLAFYPSAVCFGIYYIDPLDPNKYISLSKYFDVMQQDQMNELHDIAYALGAKHCRLEIIEEEKTAAVLDAQKQAKGQIVPKAKVIGKDQGIAELNGSIDPHIRYEKSAVRTVQFDEEFVGDAEPCQPNLRWYANDNTVRSLIEKRLGSGNKLTKYSLLLEYKTSNFMNAGIVSAIDGALESMKVKANFNLEGEYRKENRTKMELLIEF